MSCLRSDQVAISGLSRPKRPDARAPPMKVICLWMPAIRHRQAASCAGRSVRPHAGSISCTRLMSTETRDRASVGRNIDWNRAFQTISSARYDERAWTVCSSASSMPDSRTRISASVRSRSSGVRPGQRARAVDRMHDRPGERKERHLVALERQRRVAPHRAATAVELDGTEQDLRFELDDFSCGAGSRSGTSGPGCRCKDRRQRGG